MQLTLLQVLSVNCLVWFYEFNGMVCLGPWSGEVLFNVKNVMGCYCNNKGCFSNFSMQWVFHQVYKWWSGPAGTKSFLFQWLNHDFFFILLLSNGNVTCISNICVYFDCVSKSRFRLVTVYLHWPSCAQFESALFVIAQGASLSISRGYGNSCCQRNNIDRASPSIRPPKRSSRCIDAKIIKEVVHAYNVGVGMLELQLMLSN